MEPDEYILKEYQAFLSAKEFPCIAAKAALTRNHIKGIVINHMACPVQDSVMLEFMYDFVDQYRASRDSYHSAAVIFRGPLDTNDETFDQLLWLRLRALSMLDKINYQHDDRVDSDPASPTYSYSLKSEAFFIVGLHPGSMRRSRRFKYPTLVFNPHAEFEKLRKLNRYNKMKDVVRKRDVVFSGSVNPLLDDFGSSSEVNQYSGIRHNAGWKCPLGS